MHESGLILTLTGSLAAALLLGFAIQRIGMSPIVGYLLAGVIVGPYTPGFVADRSIANEFAEVGVILLMFGVGLHFHPKDLLAFRNVTITGALGQSAVATLFGAIVGRQFGWSWSASIVFGLALSVASTVMLTRVLADNQDLQSPAGRIAIGWLVVEDILTVIILVLIPAVFSATTSDSASILTALAITTGKLALLATFAYTVGKRWIPRMLSGVASGRSREMFTLTVLVLALGIAVGSAIAFGVSMALGAFLAGMIVGQSEFSFRAASEALPMRDAFAVLFFVSVGMLLDPSALAASPGLLISTLGVILIGKPLVAFLIVRLFKFDTPISAAVAIALAQIGEFSLIVAGVGDQLQILPAGATNIVVASAMISLALNPVLYRWVRRLKPKAVSRKEDAAREPLPLEAPGALQAVVIGYGPTGQTVSRLLHEHSIEPVIVEMNLDAARRAREEGYASVYGDATRPDILEAAGIGGAAALIVVGPASMQGAEIIRLARRMNGNLRVLSRTQYLSEVARVRDAGADAVFSGEGEVALAMSEHILTSLGVTPEQMDQERRRVREEVFRTRSEAPSHP